MLTFFMLAGEASGDQHAARLILAIKQLDPSARFVGMGGEKMRAAGLEAQKDLEGMQVVGFWEVAKRFGFFRRVFDDLLGHLKQHRPDAVICVDYPGFNLNFAKAAHKMGIPVFYYIVPQVWAWKAMRAKSMARYVDRAFCVFDFEAPFFERFGLKTEFIGHPLLDRSAAENEHHRAAAETLGKLRAEAGQLVSLLPGSRAGEFSQHARIMASAARAAQAGRPGLQALMSVPAGMPKKIVADVEAELGSNNGEPAEKRILFAPQPPEGKSRAVNASDVSHATVLPAAADFSVVKSGTSTLEAALSGKPMCVIYRGSAVSYAIAHLLVNIPVFSLVNIVLGRYAVPELIQDEVNPARLAQEIERGLCDSRYREQQQAALAELPKKLGGPGASQRAAKSMLDYLKGK